MKRVKIPAKRMRPHQIMIQGTLFLLNMSLEQMVSLLRMSEHGRVILTLHIQTSGAYSWVRRIMDIEMEGEQAGERCQRHRLEKYLNLDYQRMCGESLMF